MKNMKKYSEYDLMKVRDLKLTAEQVGILINRTTAAITTKRYELNLIERTKKYTKRNPNKNQRYTKEDLSILNDTGISDKTCAQMLGRTKGSIVQKRMSINYGYIPKITETKVNIPSVNTKEIIIDGVSIQIKGNSIIINTK